MLDKVRAVTEKYIIPAQTNRLLIALSGGADSVCLLHVFLRLQGEYGLGVEALHLNHCLRADESDRDEGFVRALCGAVGIPLTVERAQVAALAEEAGESLEECARRIRYGFFEREAKSRGALVATGHNQDDNAETVILNLIRGTGLRGLCGIPRSRGIFVRPLLSLSRPEIEAYCHENGLKYVTDSSNASHDFTRNRIRHRIMPLLRAENPRFLERTAGMAERLRDDADFLDGLAEEALQSIGRDKGFDREAFLALPPAISLRVLMRILKGAGLSAGRDTVLSLAGMIRAGEGARSLGGDISLKSGKKSFRLIKKEKPQPFFSVDITVDELLAGGCRELYSGKIVSFSTRKHKVSKNMPEILKKGFTCAIDCDRISKIVTFRGRLPADRLRLNGRGCSKTLKNIFQEAGISPAGRTRLAVVADELGIIAVEGIGVCERAAISPETGRALILYFPEGRNAQ
ncbi:MAG: tRNA lysidine(34) synthetase TilS [Oscillospiraceae bacterium]|jgi:tRNA(Ile)-lysidine synthase|nr:tRNA lysidine(34) synthetase TilS [Oscillospiraceae bacterium]